MCLLLVGTKGCRVVEFADDDDVMDMKKIL